MNHGSVTMMKQPTIFFPLLSFNAVYLIHRMPFWSFIVMNCPLVPTETAAAAADVVADGNNNTSNKNNNDAVIVEDPEYYYVDPDFFDSGYTLAGKTGFQMWTGTRLLIEALLWKLPSSKSSSCSCSGDDHHQYQDFPRLQYWQERLLRSNGLHALEFGAGVGVVGTYLAAAAGVHVLLTDLPTLVNHSIAPSLKRNHPAFRRENTKNQNNITE